MLECLGRKQNVAKVLEGNFIGIASSVILFLVFVFGLSLGPPDRSLEPVETLVRSEPLFRALGRSPPCTLHAALGAGVATGFLDPTVLWAWVQHLANACCAPSKSIPLNSRKYMFHSVHIGRLLIANSHSWSKHSKERFQVEVPHQIIDQ